MWPQDQRFTIPERPPGRPQYAPPAMDQLLGQPSRPTFQAHPTPNQAQRRKRASKPKVRTGCTTCKVRLHSLPPYPRHLPIRGMVLPVTSYTLASSLLRRVQRKPHSRLHNRYGGSSATRQSPHVRVDHFRHAPNLLTCSQASAAPPPVGSVMDTSLLATNPQRVAL